MIHNKKITPMAMVTSEQTIRFDFGSSTSQETFHTIQQFCRFVESDRNPLLEEVVPSNQTVTVFYRKELTNPNGLIEELLAKWTDRADGDLLTNTRSIRIPVCYDAIFSEDMDRITKHTKLTREEVIALHTATSYMVYMIGFLPGFPYLGELPDALHVPRLDKPRLRVEKGTVGIGGMQTGIYPIASPGGWNIIGRTPVDLYNPEHVDAFLIRAGDRLSFYEITIEEYQEMKTRLELEPEMLKQFVEGGLGCESI